MFNGAGLWFQNDISALLIIVEAVGKVVIECLDACYVGLSVMRRRVSSKIKRDLRTCHLETLSPR